MKVINAEVIREYLYTVGRTVADAEQVTQQELGHFCDELFHKTGAVKSTVLASLDKIELLGQHIIDHIESVVGKLPESTDEPKQVLPQQEPIKPVVAPVVAPVVETPPVLTTVTTPVSDAKEESSNEEETGAGDEKSSDEEETGAGE